MRHKKELLKMAKSLIYSALANLRGERGMKNLFPSPLVFRCI